MRIVFLAFAVLLLKPGYGVCSQPVAAERDSTIDLAVPNLPSPDHATRLSKWSTWGVPVVGLLIPGGPENGGIRLSLLFVGLLVGPAVGYFYGGEPGRGWTGIGIRGGVLALCGGVGYAAFHGKNSSDDLGPIILLGSAAFALVLGDAIYDLSNVEETIEKHNSEIQKAQLSIQPMLHVGNKNLVGLRVGVTF
jgi:hypothetical protein